MEFRIGDRVKVKEWDAIPENLKFKGFGRNAGKVGEIVDILHSNVKDCYVYRILFDGAEQHSKADFVEGTFDHVIEKSKASFTYEIEVLENLVIARLYEVTGEDKFEIARGHGHIIHSGAYGVAQAASYACKQAWFCVDQED